MINITLNQKDKGKYTRSGLPLKGLQIPNVENFRVVNLPGYDKWAKLFGLKKKLRVFEITPGGNSRVNDYLERTFDRLHRYALNRDEARFSKLVKILRRSSNSMIYLALHNVDRNWHKERSEISIYRTLRKVLRIMRKGEGKFEFKRLNIPKPTGGTRPLAIPSLEWRVVSNWYNTKLWIWDKGSGMRTENQYGIGKGKGVKACWLDLSSKMREAKDIYEFDLWKFYDTVNWASMTQELVGYPKELTSWMVASTLHAAKVLKEETYFENLTMMANHPRTPKVIRWILSTVASWISEKKIKDIIKEGLKEIEYKPTWEGETKEGSLNGTLEKGLRRGVPQGFGLSPFLACNTLRRVLNKWGNKLIMYVDDGILLGNISEGDIKEFEKDLWEAGEVALAPEKSKYIKRNGEWLSELKFLGVTYNP